MYYYLNGELTVRDFNMCVIDCGGVGYQLTISLTTSESLTKGLPMVIVNPIPGQEQRNTEFLLNNGAACAASKTCPIDECLYQLLTSPARLDAMRQCVRALSKTGATERVCRFALELAVTPIIEK